MHIIGGPPLSYEPADKSDAIENLINSLTPGQPGRRETISSGMCRPKPIGCGEPIGPFKDAASEHEYVISGLCQTCQDSVFVEEDE